MENQKLFAFWKYDQFPTKQCLGAPVQKLEKNGIVVPENYGGYKFKHFYICPLEEGIEIHNKLEELDVEYQKELKLLKNKYSKLHDAILKVPK